MVKALDGVTVLEFASSLGAAYTAMLMAEQGARAIRIEPPGGDPRRGTPYFHVLNRSKQALFLDLNSDGDLAQAHDLIAIADVLVSGFTPARQRSFGLDYDSVRRRNASAILLEMPPLGNRGPYAEMPADDDLLCAWGGIFGTQAARSGKPVAMTFPMASYQAGLMGAAAVTAGLIARGNGGTGQAIEVSGLAAALSLQTGDFLRNPRLYTSRPGPADPMGPYAVIYLYRGSDGLYFIIDCTSARFCQRLAEAVGLPQLFSDPRFKDAPWSVPKAHIPALREALQGAFLQRPRDEWIRILRQHEVPAAPVMTRAQFLDDPQVRHLGMRREIYDPTLGPTVQIGLPVNLTATPGEIIGPAPALHNSNPQLGALLDEARTKRPAPTAGAHSSGKSSVKGPLAGITVLDFSSYIAGSFGPMILAQMGADVIKIEGRDGDSLRYVTGFRGWNQNKRGLGLDLKNPAGLEIAHALVRKADVVFENFRPGRTRAYGIDYETLSAINPRIVYMSVTGYGSDGPDCDRPGLDPLAQALSGSMAAHSGEGRGPSKGADDPRHALYLTEPIADYGAATLGALGCVLALRARQVTGMGQLCRTSLLQAVAALQVGEFIFYAGRPNLEIGAPELRGTSALHSLYQCRDGNWLYLSVADATRWNALSAQVPGIGAMTFDQASGEDTDGNLARVLSGYFASRPAQELLDKLFAGGVTVAPVAHISQLFEDPQVIANELAADVEESELGIVRQPTQFAKFQGVANHITPAPRLGEHSGQVLADLLGYNADRIAKLRAAGVIFGD